VLRVTGHRPRGTKTVELDPSGDTSARRWLAPCATGPGSRAVHQGRQSSIENLCESLVSVIVFADRKLTKAGARLPGLWARRSFQILKARAADCPANRTMVGSLTPTSTRQVAMDEA